MLKFDGFVSESDRKNAPGRMPVLKKAVEKTLKTACAFALSLLLLAGCASQSDLAQSEQHDIVILFTSDVHCSIEDNLGYAGLATYREKMEAATPYVTLVDLGDAVQGGAIGMVSQGELIVDIMNEVGYDLAVLGNHEFDYGTEQLAELVAAANYTYLNGNISFIGQGVNPVENLEPWAIVEYGDTSVGFVGITTPLTLTSSTPTCFLEDGELVYDFAAGDEGELLYAAIQGHVEACREAGADYVVLLAHLGNSQEYAPYSSAEVAAHTTGIDAILDGHAHSTISCLVVKNAAGDDVVISSAGTGLSSIGQLVIGAGGVITVGLVDGLSYVDDEAVAFIDDIQLSFEAELAKVVATSDVALSIRDENGIRTVRNRETAIGSLIADAYRFMGGSDIALAIGGAIRADLPAGDITYADVLTVSPGGDMLCTVETTGQDILDCLELACRFTQTIASEDGKAVGECGAFMHVSGLRYAIDTSVPSGVMMDESNMLAGIEGARRICDVEVRNAAGEWEPLDPEKTYTVTAIDYIIKQMGDGITVFADDPLVVDSFVSDYQALASYIVDGLNGQVGSKYSAVEGRIAVR